MYSPGQAILWQIGWRARYGLAAAAAFLITSIILVQILPTHLTIQFNNENIPAVAWFLGVPCVFMNILLIAAFGMTGADSRNLNFASHMFVLPVKTRTLVAWPMLSGALTVSCVWLLVASLVFRPGGIATPLWWPAAALALVLATFQAIAWTPFAQRWIHAALTVVVFMTPLIALLVFLILDIQLSEAAIALFLVGLIPLAYIAAVNGVERARRAEPYDWQAWNRLMLWIGDHWRFSRRPFRAIARAQLWFECRANSVLPLFIGAVMIMFIFVPALEINDVALGWRLLGIMLATPLFIASVSGSALGALHDPFSKADTASFVLARPISTLSIVRCKLKAAGLMTAFLWIIMLAWISLLLARPGFYQSVVDVVTRVGPWKAASTSLVLLLLLFALTWKNMVNNLWVTLTGRAWVANVNSFGFVGLLVLAIGVGLWIYFHPNVHAAALAGVPWLIGLAVLAKITAAAIVMRRLFRRRLVSAAEAVRLVGIWGAAVAVCFAIAIWMLPAPNFDVSQVLPGLVLLVPFVRLTAAPLALDWNRHR